MIYLLFFFVNFLQFLSNVVFLFFFLSGSFCSCAFFIGICYFRPFYSLLSFLYVSVCCCFVRHVSVRPCFLCALFVYFCLLLLISICFFHVLSASVHFSLPLFIAVCCCPFLSIFIHFDYFFFRFCPILSVSLCVCQVLCVFCVSV